MLHKLWKPCNLCQKFAKSSAKFLRVKILNFFEVKTNTCRLGFVDNLASPA